MLADEKRRGGIAQASHTDGWPARFTISLVDLGLAAVGAVLHVALKTVELAAYQFDPHRRYDP